MTAETNYYRSQTKFIHQKTNVIVGCITHNNYTSTTHYNLYIKC